MRGNDKMDVFNYLGSFYPKYLIDYIREMDKYFDMEQVEDPKIVKVSFLKMKGHASLWRDNVQSIE